MKAKIPVMLLIFFLVVSIPACTQRPVGKTTVEYLKQSTLRENRYSTAYIAYERQAEKEGLSQVAKLFKALAIAEGIHKKNFVNVLDLIGEKIEVPVLTIVGDSTKYNLQTAIKGEIGEIDSIYPACIQEAKKCERKEPLSMFYYAWAAEKSHRYLLVAIYDFYITEAPKDTTKTKATQPSHKNLVELDEGYLSKVYYVCPVDGIIYDDLEVPDSCSMSHTPRNSFIKVQ